MKDWRDVAVDQADEELCSYQECMEEHFFDVGFVRLVLANLRNEGNDLRSEIQSCYEQIETLQERLRDALHEIEIEQTQQAAIEPPSEEVHADLIEVQDAADILGMSRGLVYHLRRTGQINTYGEASNLYSRPEIVAIKEERDFESRLQEMTLEKENLVGVEEAAKMLGCYASAVYAFVNSGKLASYATSHRRH